MTPNQRRSVTHSVFNLWIYYNVHVTLCVDGGSTVNADVHTSGREEKSGPFPFLRLITALIYQRTVSGS
jgi:hypothetical protein